MVDPNLEMHDRFVFSSGFQDTALTDEKTAFARRKESELTTQLAVEKAQHFSIFKDTIDTATQIALAFRKKMY